MGEEDRTRRYAERLTQITKEEWDDIHDPKKCNALTVTRLVEFMGLGYKSPHTVLNVKEHTDFVKTLLEYGRNMEEIAVKVFQLFKDPYEFEGFDVPGKNEIWFSMLGWDPITETTRKILMRASEHEFAGKPLYGSPDLLAITKNGETHPIEIKCPRDQLCLIDMETKEDAATLGKQKAYIHSKDRRILKKLAGHILQVCTYAWILSKVNGAKVSDYCTLVYFYPDIAANKYFLVTYEIDWQEILNEDETWDLELVIQEYYEKFVPALNRGVSPRLLRRMRRGIYPFLDDEQTMMDLLVSKGIRLVQTLIIGGESTKEITSYAMDRFLTAPVEQTS